MIRVSKLLQVIRWLVMISMKVLFFNFSFLLFVFLFCEDFNINNELSATWTYIPLPSLKKNMDFSDVLFFAFLILFFAFLILFCAYFQVFILCAFYYWESLWLEPYPKVTSSSILFLLSLIYDSSFSVIFTFWTLYNSNLPHFSDSSFSAFSNYVTRINLWFWYFWLLVRINFQLQLTIMQDSL